MSKVIDRKIADILLLIPSEMQQNARRRIDNLVRAVNNSNIPELKWKSINGIAESMNEAKANRMLEILLDKGYTDWPNLKGRSRVREVNDIRQICMWIIRHGTSMSLHNIGAIFVRHHATILHAIEHVDNMIQTDSIYRSKVEQMLSYLNNEHLNKVFYKLVQ